MEESFILGDELGPARIIHVHQAQFGLKGILVVDNVAAGPAIGGLRMAPDASLQECARLARAMTLKSAAAGLSHGGAKSVLIADPHMPKADKERLIRAFAFALRNEVDYICGPDMGTNEEAMAWVKDEIGRAVGLPREIGGIPLDEIGVTGLGIAVAAEVAAERAGINLQGARVAIQGFGAVGQHTTQFLAERGAVLVAVADCGGTLVAEEGLDIAQLIALKRENRSVVDASCGRVCSPEAIIDTPCDIWIPAARPDVIHERNVDRLDTRLVIQGANIPMTITAEQRLHQKGILCIPDFIANAGGLICATLEYAGASEDSVLDTVASKLRQNTADVLDCVDAQKITPREAAMAMARDRVERAMSWQRWGGL